MATLTISNWHRGLIPQYWKDNHLAYMGQEGQYIDGIFNPILDLGYLSPTSDTFTSTATTAIEDSGEFSNAVQLLTHATTNRENIMLIGKGKELENFQGLDKTFEADGALIIPLGIPIQINPSAGTHSSHTDFEILELVKYQLDGEYGVFFFFKDNADADAGFVTMDNSQQLTNETQGLGSPQYTIYSSATGSGVLDERKPIVTEVADNGFMYVSNGNILERFDGSTFGGTTGTVSESLRFDPGFLIQGMKDIRSLLWILIEESVLTSSGATIYSDRAKAILPDTKHNWYVLVWDRVERDVSVNDAIKLDGISDVSGIYDWKSVPIIFTRTWEEGVCEIRTYSNGVFVVEKEIDFNAFPVSKNAVQTGNKYIKWVGRDGVTYAYGKSTVEQQSNQLYKVQELNVDFDDADTTHVTLESHKDDLIYFISDSANSIKKTESSDLFDRTATANSGDYISKVEYLPKLSSLNRITVYYPPIDSDANVNSTLELYINGSSTPISYNINHQDSPDGDGDVGFFTKPLGGKNFTNVNSVQIGWKFNSTQSIDNSIRPSRVDIEYETTNKTR